MLYDRDKKNKTKNCSEQMDGFDVEVQGEVESFNNPNSACCTFQLIDVKVLDRLPPAIGDDEHEFDSDIVHDRSTNPSAVASSKYARECVVCLFGCTAKGNSVMVRIIGFRPYLLYKKGNRRLEDVRTDIARRVNDWNLDAELSQRCNMYGWEPSSDPNKVRGEITYVKIGFPNVRTLREASKHVDAHEAQIDVETKFLDFANITASGWVSIKGKHITSRRISSCKLEIECDPFRASSVHYVKHCESSQIAPLMVANVDIECVSRTGGFPDAENDGDIIAMVGMVCWRVGMDLSKAVRHIFVVGECDSIPGVTVHTSASELEMLYDFRNYVVKDADPDVVVTYNGFGFDLKYLWSRAEKLGGQGFKYLSRFAGQRSTHTNRELTSSALGQNDLFFINMVGRSNLDMYHWIKSSQKLASYKLDDVGHHFLQKGKVEMDYQDLFRILVGTPEEKAKAAAYCIQDCVLLVELAICLQTFPSNVEMSRVSHTLMEALVTRGQQIKVMNQLVWYGHRMQEYDKSLSCSYVINTPDEWCGSENDTYEGATVIDAKAGFYSDMPVATLDFMSLYPSIILANNFCFSTLVQNAKYLTDEYQASMAGTVAFKTIKVSENKTYTFADIDGVIPTMLRVILSARKNAKKKMLEARDKEEERVFNARQKALKISANSIYGFTGAVKNGKYPCLAVADSVTFKAREMLHQTVKYVIEFDPGCNVIYGDTDSIMVIFSEHHSPTSAFETGEKAATFISSKFPDDVILEMEKVYFPFLLLKKKRYAGLTWNRNSDGAVTIDGLDAKGTELVRRDNCKFAKAVYSDVLNALMYDRSVEMACERLSMHMDNLVNSRVPRSDFQLSRALRKSYANEQLAHVNVVKKMKERRPGSEPQPGERVQFVYLETKNAQAKAWQKAEDPRFADANNLKLDRLYYLDHQIVTPISSLLGDVIESPKTLFNNARRSITLQQTRQKSIASFVVFSKPAAESLAVPDGNDVEEDRRQNAESAHPGIVTFKRQRSA